MILTVILLIILFLSIGVNVFLIYKLPNLYKKFNTLESMYNELSEKYDTDVAFYEEKIKEIGYKIMQLFIKLKEIDEKQIFEKDDEVGFVFTSLVDEIKNFNEMYKNEFLNENENTTDKKEDK